MAQPTGRVSITTVNLGIRSLQARAVASLQRILCSFWGTANFDLRQARRVLATRTGVGQVHTQSIFKNPAQRANAFGLFQVAVAPNKRPSAGERRHASAVMTATPRATSSATNFNPRRTLAQRLVRDGTLPAGLPASHACAAPAAQSRGSASRPTLRDPRRNAR
jgi:hypothetical protein